MLKRIVSSKDFKKRFSQNETKRTNTLNTKSEARKSTKEKFSHETDLYDLDFDFVPKSQTHHIVNKKFKIFLSNLFF